MTRIGCSIDGRSADALFEVFEGGGFCLSTWRDEETGECTAQIFTPDPADAPAAAEALVAAGRAVGLALSPSIETFPDEDWTLAYRKWFHAYEVSPRLAICPAWEDFAAAPGQRVVRLDPGLAFGTGKHETTRSCLEFLDRLASEDSSRTVLDMGTGSGILAIAASKLGFARVRAFDIDSLAVDVARENAAANSVSPEFYVGSAAEAQEPAEIVLANILGPFLVEFASSICDSVAGGGSSRLVLSGILSSLYPEVVAAFAARGFVEIDSIVSGEWTSGLFRRALQSGETRR